jgi:hypothetical protein
VKDVFGEYRGDSVDRDLRCWQRRLLFDDFVCQTLTIVCGFLEIEFPFQLGTTPLFLVQYPKTVVEEVHPVLQSIAGICGGRNDVRFWALRTKDAELVHVVRDVAEVLC